MQASCSFIATRFTAILAAGLLVAMSSASRAAAPTGIVLDSPVATENWPANTLVGTLSAVDEDSGDSHQFSFVEGNGSLDNEGFYISGNKLYVLYGVTLDIDAELRDLQVRLRVTDSTLLSYEQAIAITVIDDRNEDKDADGLTEMEEEDIHGTSDITVDSDGDGMGDAGELNANPPTSPTDDSDWPHTGIVGWGSESNREQAAPPGGGVFALATGENHSLVLKGTGGLDGWGGYNAFGQASRPAGLDDVIEVAAGGDFWLLDSGHSLALKSDGTVVGWGYNSNGGNVVPAGLGQIISIAAGRAHGVALKSDGTVVAWGHNPHGSVQPPQGLSNVVDVSARGFYSLALRGDGTVVTWGSNFDGAQWVDATSPVGLRDVTAISAGRFHSLALKQDGTVVSWGNNSHGQTTVPPGLTNVVAVSAGGFHSMALKDDGTVVTWGSNSHGQIDIPNAAQAGVKLISAGILHSLAVIQADAYPSITSSNRILSSPGAPVNHQITVVNAVPAGFSAFGLPAGLAIDPLTGVISGSTGATRSSIKISVKTDQGTLTQFAWLGVSEGLPATLVELTPASVLENSAGGTVIGTLIATDPDVGDTHTFEWVDGSGSTDNGKFRIEGNQLILDQDSTRNFETNSSGFTIRLRARDSSLNPYEQVLAIQFLDDRSEDADGDGLTEAQEEDIYQTSDANPDMDGDGFGDGFEIARGFLPNSADSFPNGRIVMGWGLGTNGMTGPPASQQDVIRLAAGSGHSLALKSDGTVLAWGGNDDGQSTVPEGLAGVIAIDAGSAHSLALKSDGTVSCWGKDDHGQATTPELLGGVVAIAAGARHNLALKSDGSVVAWGDHTDGQCEVPPGLTDVVAISAGGVHSMVLKSDGTVIVWGAATDGITSVPVGLSGVIAIAAGGAHCIALKHNGEVIAWGSNSHGQSAVPVAASPAVRISAGGLHSLALRHDGTPVSWGDDSEGQVSVPMEAVHVKEITAGDDHNLAIRQDAGFPGFAASTEIRGWPGEAFSTMISIQNAVPSAFSAMGLPSGLVIDPVTGLVSGTPPTGERRAVRVSATTDQGTLDEVIWMNTMDGISPTDIVLSPNILAENSAAGTVVGTLSATDSNAGDSHAFQLIGLANSPDSYQFQVSGNQLIVSGPILADFDAGVTSLTIRVKAVDSGNNPIEKNLNLVLTDDRTEDADGDGISEAAEEDVLGSSDSVFDNFSRSDADSDGVPGLIEHAFNLDPKTPGIPVRLIAGAGSTAGLPAVDLVPDGLGSQRLRIEYIRRIGAGLVYAPQFSSSLIGTNWSTATQPVAVTPIDETWERCVVEDSQSVSGAARRFGRVKVSW